MTYLSKCKCDLKSPFSCKIIMSSLMVWSFLLRALKTNKWKLLIGYVRISNSHKVVLGLTGLTLPTEQITPCERAWKTKTRKKRENEYGVRKCEHFRLRVLVPLDISDVNCKFLLFEDVGWYDSRGRSAQPTQAFGWRETPTDQPQPPEDVGPGAGSRARGHRLTRKTKCGSLQSRITLTWGSNTVFTVT